MLIIMLALSFMEYWLSLIVTQTQTQTTGTCTNYWSTLASYQVLGVLGVVLSCGWNGEGWNDSMARRGEERQ